MTDLPRAPLSQEDLERIDGVNWRAFTRNTVVTVAEAWNAGAGGVAIAAQLGCEPQTIRVILGRLSQIGVECRRTVRRVPRPAPIQASAPGPTMSQESYARLERVARWDDAARGALALFHRQGGQPCASCS